MSLLAKWGIFVQSRRHTVYGHEIADFIVLHGYACQLILCQALH